MKFFKKQIHFIKTPRNIAIGEGALKAIPEFLEKLGAYSVLLIVGNKTYEMVRDDISKLLKDEGYVFDLFFCEKADYLTVYRAERKAKGIKANALIGIGGGKNIDIAKTTAYNLNVPYISVPTIPSHDGIASPCSSISRKGKKESNIVDPPACIVADMKYLYKAPYRYFAAGAGDIIAKSTSVLDWQLARDEIGEYYGEYAANLAYLASKIIIENANRHETNLKSATELLTEALISCGYAMCIAGSSRPCSGSEHLISHAIDYLYPNDILHGEKCALATYIATYYHEKDYGLIKETLEKYKLPITAKEIGIPTDVLIKAITHAWKMRDRYTILNKKNIQKGKEKEVEMDLKKLEVI